MLKKLCSILFIFIATYSYSEIQHEQYFSLILKPCAMEKAATHQQIHAIWIGDAERVSSDVDQYLDEFYYEFANEGLDTAKTALKNWMEEKSQNSQFPIVVIYDDFGFTKDFFVSDDMEINEFGKKLNFERVHSYCIGPGDRRCLDARVRQLLHSNPKWQYSTGWRSKNFHMKPEILRCLNYEQMRSMFWIKGLFRLGPDPVTINAWVRYYHGWNVHSQIGDVLMDDECLYDNFLADDSDGMVIDLCPESNGRTTIVCVCTDEINRRAGHWEWEDHQKQMQSLINAPEYFFHDLKVE